MEHRDVHSDEITLLDFLNVIKKHRKLIVTLVLVSVIVTGITSLLLTRIYRAEAVIMPALQKEDSGGMGTIAAQFGLSSQRASNAAEVVSLLKSNILMERVIKSHNLVPVFFRDRLKDNTEDEKIWQGIRYLKERIFRVKNNQKEGVIELSIEFKEPRKAADILNAILTELTEHMSSEARRVAETNKTYLESLIDKNPDPLIRQNIYSLIARQIETSMMAEVKENFAFKIIDPPKVPDRKVKPRILLNIMLSFAVSIFAGLFIAFFRDYWENVKQRKEMSGGKSGK